MSSPEVTLHGPPQSTPSSQTSCLPLLHAALRVSFSAGLAVYIGSPGFSHSTPKHEPPQSMPSSSPLRMPSLHVPHFFEGSIFSQSPPQSTPASLSSWL